MSDAIRDLSLDLTLRRWRALFGELLTAAVELEQPFDVDDERDRWLEWGRDVLRRAELETCAARFDDIDDGDGYVGAYMVELDALIARVHDAIAAAAR